jgi:pilus assembly protein CpaF
MNDGSRRVTKVCGIDGMEGDVITLCDLFVFEYSDEREVAGRVQGALRPTGLRPKFDERLRELGIRLDADIFEPALAS